MCEDVSRRQLAHVTPAAGWRAAPPRCTVRGRAAAAARCASQARAASRARSRRRPSWRCPTGSRPAHGRNTLSSKTRLGSEAQTTSTIDAGEGGRGGPTGLTGAFGSSSSSGEGAAEGAEFSRMWQQRRRLS
eukprot:4647528-Pleurochrysis_carterae.AAC.5